MAQSQTEHHHEQHRQAPRQQDQPTQNQGTPPGDPVPSQADADAILEGTYGLSKEDREKHEREKAEREKKERDMKAGEGGAYQTR